MPDYVLGALITAVAAVVLFLLNRFFGTDSAASVAAQWQGWASELKGRVAALEDDVKELKDALASERQANLELAAQNRRKSALLKKLVRWSMLLRDEVIRLGGTVPRPPVEVEDALTTLEP